MRNLFLCLLISSTVACERVETATEGDEAPSVESSVVEDPTPSAQAPEPEPEPEPEPVPPDPAEELRIAASGHGPLVGRAAELFWGSPEDSEPDVLNATRSDLEDRHYLYCDELHLYLYYERLNGLGGGYAGVGSDQAYTFIGWMRPQLAWLTDYDPWISALHRSYMAFFEVSEDIETFRSYWQRDSTDRSLTLLRERYADRDDLALIVRVFREAQLKVDRRLRRIVRDFGAVDVPTFVSDEEMYTFVRQMVIAGRIRPMLGNLLDVNALRGIGEVSRQLDVPIRAYYLSNAEGYWRYPQEFRDNFQALNFDERSVIVRTDATKPANGDYRYGLQSALNFQEWLQQDYVRRVRDIWVPPSIESEDHYPFEFFNEPPRDRREGR